MQKSKMTCGTQTYNGIHAINEPATEIDSYNTYNLRIQIEEFGTYYWQNELRMESHEDCGGNFYCSGAAILNSSVIVKFECKSISRNKGFDYISYNILHFLANTPPYKGHFTLDVKHPNFSILNSIC